MISGTVPVITIASGFGSIAKAWEKVNVSGQAEGRNVKYTVISDDTSVRVCVPEILDKVMNQSDYRNPPRRLVNEIHSLLRNSIVGLLPYENGNTNKMRTEYGVQRAYVVDQNHPHVQALRQQR